MRLPLSAFASLAVGLLHHGPPIVPRAPRAAAPRLQLPKERFSAEVDLPVLSEFPPSPPPAIEAQELALNCLVSNVLEPELVSGILADPPSQFEFECPVSAPIDPSTGLLPPGIELPVPIPTEVPSIEIPSSATEKPTQLPALRDLAAFCLPTLGIWLSSPLLSLIDTSVVSRNMIQTHPHSRPPPPLAR